jgi:hypothetical protein
MAEPARHDIQFVDSEARKIAFSRPRRPAAAQTADADRRPRLRPRQVPPTRLAARVKPIIARRKTEHGSGLGRHRWVDVIELGPLRRLGTRRLAALQRRLKNGSPCATFGPWSPRFANTDVWR